MCGGGGVSATFVMLYKGCNKVGIAYIIILVCIGVRNGYCGQQW